ncbi:hypothetical protein C7B79_01905 [Chroococcidiopsis cubana CCALA 043]|nr:hypothetical protein C7B79_01905 [Chroococcidiopsis cubana CCALA 043]
MCWGKNFALSVTNAGCPWSASAFGLNLNGLHGASFHSRRNFISLTLLGLLNIIQLLGQKIAEDSDTGSEVDGNKLSQEAKT